MQDFYLGDLIIGESIIISFIFSGKEYEFPVNVKNIGKKEIFLDVIKINGHLLPLNKSDIKVDLIYYRKDDKPLVWKNCSVVVVRDKENIPYYVFSSELKARSLNRRKDFRVPIGIQGDVSISNRNSLKATIRDLSSSGFSISLDKNTDINENDVIDITFSDFNLNYQINLSGTVVRIENYDDKIVYGCYLSKHYPQIGQYLSLKQREDLIRHSKFVDKKTRESFEMIKKTRKVIK